MFTFPLAAQRVAWEGQGALVGLLPPGGGDSLGVCFGMCCIWVANFAPLEFAPTGDDLGSIFKVQAVLNVSMPSGTAHAMDVAAEVGGVETHTPVQSHPSGTASHVILDLLASQAAHLYIVAFHYTNGITATQQGHAIAVAFDDAQNGRILDPNYGVGRYTSRTSLCNDLHNLLRTYVAPAGALTSSHLLVYDPFA